MQHLHIYSKQTPELIERLARTPAMLRLADVGMHCGCEYSGNPLYAQAAEPYSRLSHSIGVAGIVWDFTGDIHQAVAGLLHDISTPVFAHTIDFMNGDHIAQESTEASTAAFIESSKEIISLLRERSIRVEDVCDYHRYPVADNDTPMLSADRLEYTIGNACSIYHEPIGLLREIYDDLTVATNESGTEELCFRSLEHALRFARIALRNSRFYVTDEDRYNMQFLAEIIRSALDAGVIEPGDLHTTEREVIGKLKRDAGTCKAWEEYCAISEVSSSAEMPEGRRAYKVFAKKRYIDPLVTTAGGSIRVSQADDAMRGEIEFFLATDFDKWVY
ncbi:MAG: hypothetical protein FWG48_05330 [Oscillospiraceae bacterium]|nr:hypothetical protein [Oscillospiraceae bacterium]